MNKILEIKWKDACGDDGWVSLKSVEEQTLVEIKTIGYLVKETKEFITLTMALELDKTGAYLVIPKKMIISKRIIKSTNTL
ncbi:MAG TPA: hypothetical protein ENI63_01895 [Candidatus Kaiserbacteria bacterium]|nr:hypothetical protein [Candidatus Kaiserbacteria bacterium]